MKMKTFLKTSRTLGLKRLGILDRKVYYNLSYGEIHKHELRQGNPLGFNRHSNGAVGVDTGEFTGRSPADKWIVRQYPSENFVSWGETNQPVCPTVFKYLFRRVREHYNHQTESCYVFDGVCGARRGQNVRFVTEFAWQHHFVKNMFINHPADYLSNGADSFTVINASRVTNPLWRQQGLNSPNFVIMNLERKILLIGGTWYAGEMKKAVFTLMNYLLPARGILPMHCAANVCPRSGQSALYFGLSGTGKTTLSAADPKRRLIGDDEHGWDDHGVFNLEGGCYAKTDNLCNFEQPTIFQAVRRNALLENVTFNGQTPDYRNVAKTPNGRVSYPLSHVPNHAKSLTGPHPEIVIFLMCDAFGVLPPVAKLTHEQARYYFLSGYTAKVSGTERGSTTPTPTFSPCFGGAFLPLPPVRYADLFSAKIKRHDTKVYLVNTGWTGGKMGVGTRINIFHTRLILDAILDGSIERQVTRVAPVFSLEVPLSIPGVPSRLLNPARTWGCAEEYSRSLHRLARVFQQNFANRYGHDHALLKFGPVAQ
jgi:phosphoenolpyruvate carboxykinase (ATP)